MERSKTKVKEGVVVSNKMKKTVVVKVEIMECRPLSSDKCWRVVRRLGA